MIQTKRVIEDLDHRGKTVGGAGSVGDELLFSREDAIIHAKHDGRINIILCGRRQDNFLCSCRNMQLELLAACENASAFDDDVDSKGSPWKL